MINPQKTPQWVSLAVTQPPRRVSKAASLPYITATCPSFAQRVSALRGPLGTPQAPDLTEPLPHPAPPAGPFIVSLHLFSSHPPWGSSAREPVDVLRPITAQKGRVGQGCGYWGTLPKAGSAGQGWRKVPAREGKEALGSLSPLAAPACIFLTVPFLPPLPIPETKTYQPMASAAGTSQ